MKRREITERLQEYFGRQVRAGMMSRQEAQERARERGIDLQAGARARELVYLNDAVKLLRRYVKGFDAAAGYDLREIPSWTASQVNRARRMAEDLRIRLNRPHAIGSPKRYRDPKKRQAFRRALERETGLHQKGWEHFPVPTRETKRKQRVVLSPEGTVERRDYWAPDRYTVERFWYFRDYLRPKRQPVTQSEFMDAARRMLKDLPDFKFFKFFTDVHGSIGNFMGKDVILEEMAMYFNEYIKDREGFGVILMGITLFADSYTIAGSRQREYERSQAKKHTREKDKIKERRERYLKRQLIRRRKADLAAIERQIKEGKTSRKGSRGAIRNLKQSIKRMSPARRKARRPK